MSKVHSTEELRVKIEKKLKIMERLTGWSDMLSDWEKRYKETKTEDLKFYLSEITAEIKGLREDLE